MTDPISASWLLRGPHSRECTFLVLFFHTQPHSRSSAQIIASVSEHQPTAWPAFFFDQHILIYLFPVGVFYCFHKLRNEHVFVIIYAMVGSYFAGVMVRLMLTLTPVICVASSVVVARLYETFMTPRNDEAESSSASTAADVPGKNTRSKKKAAASSEPSDISFSDTPGISSLDGRAALLGFFSLLLVVFCFHCTWVTSNAYSSPSVVLASRTAAGEQVIIDDFREAYYWLRQNTKEDAKVMSWWDYGYQLAGFADRTTLVDVRLPHSFGARCSLMLTFHDFVECDMEQHSVRVVVSGALILS